MTEADAAAEIAPEFGSFVSGVAVTFLTRVIILGCFLGSSVLVARWLGPEGTGALAVLNVTVALALQLGSAGLPSATTYFVARDRSALASVWINGIIFSFFVGSVLAIIVIALGSLKPDLFNGVSSRLITIVALSIPFQLLTLLGLNLLLAIDRIKSMNSFDALPSLLLFVNAIVVLVIWRQQLPMLVSFNTVATIGLSLLLVWYVARITRTLRRPNISLLKMMLTYGLKFYVSIVASFIIFRVDLLIVNRFRGAEAAGVYAVAAQMSFLLIMLPGVIASLLFPRVASLQDETAAYTVEVTRHTSFVMLIVCAGAAAASFALPVVYGPRFGEATMFLLIMLPGIFFISLESVLVQHFTGTGLPAIIPVFWLITMLANIGLNLALIPVWGARAAAINSTISYALIFILVAAYFCRRTGRNPLAVFSPSAREFHNVYARLRRRPVAR